MKKVLKHQIMKIERTKIEEGEETLLREKMSYRRLSSELWERNMNISSLCFWPSNSIHPTMMQINWKYIWMSSLIIWWAGKTLMILKWDLESSGIFHLSLDWWSTFAKWRSLISLFKKESLLISFMMLCTNILIQSLIDFLIYLKSSSYSAKCVYLIIIQIY